MTKFTVDDYKDICKSYGLIVDEYADSRGLTNTLIAHKPGINEAITKFIVADGWIKFWINIFPQNNGYIRTLSNGDEDGEINLRNVFNTREVVIEKMNKMLTKFNDNYKAFIKEKRKKMIEEL